MLWFLIGVMLVVALGVLLWPFLGVAHGIGARRGYDLEVYRAQLEDLKTDRERGVVSESEESSARTEIERRMLRVESPDTGAAKPASSRLTTAVGAAVAVAVPIAAVAAYAWLGQPNVPSAPLAERFQMAERAGAPGDAAGAQGQPSPGELDDAVRRLASRLEANPNDFRGWLLLGRSYLVTGRVEEASEAYRHALSLPEGASDPTANSALGEALVMAASGTVTAEALPLFERALALDEADPGARYYLGVAAVQEGNIQRAFDLWLALAKDSAPDAPWLDAVRERLERAADELGIDLAAVLPPVSAAPPVAAAPPADAAPPARGPSQADVAAARDMSADDRQAMIRTMVGRLAARLEEAPDDFTGWMRLGQSYGVLGEPAKARDAFARAAALRPNDVDVQLGFARAATQAARRVTAEALGAYRQVLAIQADNPDALWFLGAADAEAGRNAEARTKWQRLLASLATDSDRYRVVKERLDALPRS